MTSSPTSNGLLATTSRFPNDIMQSSTGNVPRIAEDVTDLITVPSVDVGNVNDDDSSGSSAVGIAIGVSITCAVVLIVIAALIYLLVRRRHLRRREKNIVRIENPQYKFPEDEHHLTAEVAAPTLSTAPTVKFTSNTNASLLNSSNGRKKKEEAPLPPIYRPPSGTNATNKTKEVKREAPQPPQSLHLELYEKDSPTGGSLEDLTVVTNVTTSPAEEIAVTPGIEATSHLQHLIAAPADGNKRQLSPNRTSAKRVSENSQVSNEHEDIGCSDDLTGADLKTALLGPTEKLSSSKMSLDSYDKTMNPFFASNN